MNPATEAGRSCPLHYRYNPGDFRVPAARGMDDLEVLYVVGGLYGNELALEQVLRLFDQETGKKRLVFNGDFHWFDAEPDWFERIQKRVLGFDATRGNVETELALAETDFSTGCGCAYPDWVDNGTVDRSNRILRALHAEVSPSARQCLGELPMWLRAHVGGIAVGIVHGDATSLAGWGFARENLRHAAHRQSVNAWFESAGIDVFASSHTCAPVFATCGAGAHPHWVLNNGAAGMPNLQATPGGLFTRIATRAFQGPQLQFRAKMGPVLLEVIAIDYDQARWLTQFSHRWPPGSDAHVSYFDRITQSAACALTTTIALET
jgi:hypothetical protein